MAKTQPDKTYDPNNPVDPMTEPIDSMDNMPNMREAANKSLISMLTKDEGIFNASKLKAELSKITETLIEDPYGDEAYKTLTGDPYLFNVIEGVMQVYWLAHKAIRKQADEITKGGAGRAYWLYDKFEDDWAIYEASEGIEADFKSLEDIKDQKERLDAISEFLDNRPPLEQRYKTLRDLINAGEFEPALNKAIAKITAKPIKTSDFPLDKPNRKIWDLLETADKNGQLKFNIGVEESGSDKEINIAYAINFDELDKIPNLKITKKLTRYDKRVYIAVDALFKAGYVVMTINQIYAAMGHEGTPGSTDRKKIDKSLTKMRHADVYLDNTDEVNNHRSKSLFQYDSSLLPMARVKNVEANGNPTNAAIRVLMEPPLMAFARQRKQFTTIKIGLLNSPLNQTDANLRLEDYFLEEIPRIKNGRRQAKMLYETIFEEIRAKTRKQRMTAKNNIPKLLDHYKREGWIKGYVLLDDGIRIRP